MKSDKSRNTGISTGRIPASKGYAARRIDPEEGFTFSEEDHPYAGPHGVGGGLAAKYQVPSKADTFYQESAMDDASGKHSVGGSDIELVVQGNRTSTHAL